MAELMDYVKDGKVYQNVQMYTIQVESEEDLALLTGYGYAPGTIAHTAGWKNAWELGADGNWVDMMESAEEVDGDE